MSVLAMVRKKSSNTRQSIQQKSGGPTSGSAEATGGPTETRDNNPAHAQASDSDVLVQEIQELRVKQVPFQMCFENLKAVYQRKYTMIVDALQEERYRCKLLKAEINDLTVLHQNEIWILKEELSCMEEKIAYMTYENATDIYEELDACQTRLFKLEQLQHTVQLQGLEHDTAEALGKIMEILSALKAIPLAFMSVVASYVIPLMKTCGPNLFVLLLLLHAEGVS